MLRHVNVHFWLCALLLQVGAGRVQAPGRHRCARGGTHATAGGLGPARAPRAVQVLRCRGGRRAAQCAVPEVCLRPLHQITLVNAVWLAQSTPVNPSTAAALHTILSVSAVMALT